jgi:hypothetical protein
MADHTIVITLIDNIHAVPVPSKSMVYVGDRLRYDTDPPNLPFRVEVPDSPFTEVPALVIEDRNPRLLVTEGKFSWRCFLQRPDGEFVGWSPGEDPESGGDVDVRP